ncbi:alpha/beta-hydrolase family protein [Cutibacterium equinum]|uniref:Alpha/beta-hydrolase family protein n=2 Tax=Cutibacterium equinum TaxID=3016342 RepID=A0ABY7QWW3_9ACTN|nr:alpha/beta-hydrolase family protein [Cutibacterium equinum]WCC79551.1 alpha/beta-hydrolase family protein [Cutibacterium equinum]
MVPRTWSMVAVNVWLSTLVAYGVGGFIGRISRWLAEITRLQVTVSTTAVRSIRRSWYILLALISGWMFVWCTKQQKSVSEAVGLPRKVWTAQTLGVFIGLILFTATVLLIRLIAHGIRNLYTGVHRFIAQPVLAIIVVVLSVSLLLWATNNVIVRTTANGVAHVMARTNAQTAAGRTPPTSPLRSGSPASLQSWESLGRQGKDVVTDGPDAAKIEKVTGRPAKEPIRVYAGLNSRRDYIAEANGVLAELIRTGAFNRKVLVVQNGTGSGWIEEWSVSAVEYLTGGDCATATMQYSYLGSVGAFLLDRESPKEGARALFNVIHDYWATLDPQTRPKLYTSGVSLGSYGGQSAFSSIDDMISKVDGAVWVGTPGFTPIWKGLEANRRDGSPAIVPVIDNGRIVRFMGNPDEIHHDHWGAAYSPWSTQTRIAYVQHPSDPVTWWSPEMLWSEPDWMRERAGDDVNPHIRWTPWSSFWQVAADMALSTTPPGGHGHNYHSELVPIWSAVLNMPSDRQTMDAIAKAIPSTSAPR